MDSQTELRYRQSNRLLSLLLDNHTVEEVVETISYLMEKPVVFKDATRKMQTLNHGCWNQSLIPAIICA